MCTLYDMAGNYKYKIRHFTGLFNNSPQAGTCGFKFQNSNIFDLRWNGIKNIAYMACGTLQNSKSIFTFNNFIFICNNFIFIFNNFIFICNNIFYIVYNYYVLYFYFYLKRIYLYGKNKFYVA